MSKKTVDTLVRMAANQHVDIQEPVWICHSEKSRFSASPSLLWLEQNLFRPHQEICHFSESDEKDQGIFLYSLPNPRQELEFVAGKIQELVREQKYRYKDIAIVCGDVEMYGNYAEEIFDTYEIPLFLDTRKDILFHPMTEFLRGMLFMVEQDFLMKRYWGTCAAASLALPWKKLIFWKIICLPGISGDLEDGRVNGCAKTACRIRKNWIKSMSCGNGFCSSFSLYGRYSGERAIRYWKSPGRSMN